VSVIVRDYEPHDLDVLGHVRVQLDLEPRERRAGERVAGREFRI